MVTIITPKADGPNIIKAGPGDPPLQVVAADGRVLKEGPIIGLCRCGHSNNKPFCDGSHGKVGFKDTGNGPTAREVSPPAPTAPR